MSWREREGKTGDRARPLANATKMASMMEKFSTPATGASPNGSPRSKVGGKQTKFSDADDSVESSNNQGSSKPISNPLMPALKTKSLNRKSSLSSMSSVSSANSATSTEEVVAPMSLGNRAPRDRSQSRSPARGLSLTALGEGKERSRSKSNSLSRGLNGVLLKSSSARGDSSFNKAAVNALMDDVDDDDDGGDPDIVALKASFPEKSKSELSQALFAHGHDFEATWTTLDAKRRGGGIVDRGSRSSSINERSSSNPRSRSGSRGRGDIDSDSSSNSSISSKGDSLRATKPIGGMAARRRIGGGGGGVNTSFPSPILDTSLSQDDVLANEDSAMEQRMKTRFRSQDNTLLFNKMVGGNGGNDEVSIPLSPATGYGEKQEDLSLNSRMNQGVQDEESDYMVDRSFLNDTSMMNETLPVDNSMNLTQNESIAINESQIEDISSASMYASFNNDDGEGGLYQHDDLEDDRSTPNFLSAVKKKVGSLMASVREVSPGNLSSPSDSNLSQSQPPAQASSLRESSTSLRESTDDLSEGGKQLLGVLNRNKRSNKLDFDSAADEGNEAAAAERQRLQKEEEEDAGAEQRRLLADILNRHRAAPKLDTTLEPEFEVKPIAPIGKFLRRTDWQKQEDKARLANDLNDDEADEPKDKGRKFTISKGPQAPITAPPEEPQGYGVTLELDDDDDLNSWREAQELKDSMRSKKPDEEEEIPSNQSKRATSSTLSKMKLHLDKMKGEMQGGVGPSSESSYGGDDEEGGSSDMGKKNQRSPSSYRGGKNDLAKEASGANKKPNATAQLFSQPLRSTRQQQKEANKAIKSSKKAAQFYDRKTKDIEAKKSKNSEGKYALAEPFRPKPKPVLPYRHDATWAQKSLAQSTEDDVTTSEDERVKARLSASERRKQQKKRNNDRHSSARSSTSLPPSNYHDDPSYDNRMSPVKPYRHDGRVSLSLEPHGPPVRESHSTGRGVHERRGLHMDYVHAQAYEADGAHHQIIEAFAEPFYIPDFHGGGVLGKSRKHGSDGDIEESDSSSDSEEDDFEEGQGGGIKVSIKGEGVGSVYIVACLLCDVPAKVLSQTVDEVVVLADCYHEGLKHPLIGNIELQNTRDEVLVFTDAFAYVPVSLLIVGDNDENQDICRWEVEDIVDTTYMASKISPSHSISMGFDELNFTMIRHWHTVQMKVDPYQQSLFYKLGEGDSYHLVCKLNIRASERSSNARDPSAKEHFAKLFSQSKQATVSGGGNGSGRDGAGPTGKAFSVILDRERKNGRECTLSLVRDGFSLVIQTESSEQQIQWAAALQHAIDDNKHVKIESLLPVGLGMPVAARKAISSNPITIGKRRGRNLNHAFHHTTYHHYHQSHHGHGAGSRSKSPDYLNKNNRSKSPHQRRRPTLFGRGRKRSKSPVARHYWQH